jgi:hypothetical protein
VNASDECEPIPIKQIDRLHNEESSDMDISNDEDDECDQSNTSQANTQWNMSHDIDDDDAIKNILLSSTKLLPGNEGVDVEFVSTVGVLDELKDLDQKEKDSDSDSSDEEDYICKPKKKNEAIKGEQSSTATTLDRDRLHNEESSDMDISNDEDDECDRSNTGASLESAANSVLVPHSSSSSDTSPEFSGLSPPLSSSHDGSSRSSYSPRAEEDKSSVAHSTSCIPSPAYEASRTQPSSLPAEASIVTFSPSNSSSNNRKRKTVSEETTSEQQHDPKRRRV